MRIFSPFFCLAVIAIAADGVAQGASTRWDHNGSLVSLSATGARRQFHYQSPAEDLLQIGVQPGTLLFDGRRDGDKYSGTAYVFSKVCGARAYAVAGPVSPDRRAVSMYGKAPIVNSSCRVIGYRDDVLVFSLSPEAQTNTNQSYAEQNTLQQTQQGAPSQQAYDIEYDRFVQQFMACFERSQSIDVSIMACNSALSFPRLIEDDRSKLFQRRIDLTRQWEQLTAKKPIGFPQGNVDSSPNSASGTQSCGGACSYCDRRTGVCLVSSDGTTPQEESKGTSFREENKKTFFDRIDYATLQSVAALVVAATLAGILWLRFGIENTRAEVPSRTTGQPLEAVPGQQARMLESSLEAHAPDQLPSNSGEVPAGNPPELGNLILPPSQSMSLKLKRSDRRHFTGKIIFMLDARIGLNAEEHALVKKYRLGGFVVYDSQARERHREATKEHLETTREHPPLSSGMTSQLLGLGKTFYRLGRASVSATMAALSLRITVDSLIGGVHVECDSMDELLGAERAIKEAATNLKGYLEEAATFDGREEIVEL